jgi:hypothetical protein
MALDRDRDCIEFARECMVIAAQSKDDFVRQQFMEMARNWMIAAMGGDDTSQEAAASLMHH